ncbi:MAG TPA: FAD-dependent monooxygenase, partial [Candidatus Binataceae bacterium]
DEWIGEMARHTDPAMGAHLRASRAMVTHPFLLDVVSDRLVKWTRPGLLLLGDAAHPMSPVGGQGINMALRDGAVAANHLVPLMLSDATPEQMDSAARDAADERLREVAIIQTRQQAGPRVLFSQSVVSRLILPIIVRVAGQRWASNILINAFRGSFARGATEVRLHV